MHNTWYVEQEQLVQEIRESQLLQLSLFAITNNTIYIDLKAKELLYTPLHMGVLNNGHIIILGEGIVILSFIYREVD